MRNDSPLFHMHLLALFLVQYVVFVSSIWTYLVGSVVKHPVAIRNVPNVWKTSMAVKRKSVIWSFKVVAWQHQFMLSKI